MTADLTIRLLTPDLHWDDYLDLVMRAFGPMDGSRIRANIEPAVATAGAWARSRAVGWSGPRCSTTCASGGAGATSRWPG